MLLFTQRTAHSIQQVLYEGFDRSERCPQFMRYDADKGAFEPVQLLELLHGRLENTRPILNPSL